MLRHTALLVALLARPAVADEPPPQRAPRTPALEQARAQSTAIADLAEQVAPATVHIEVRKTRELSKGLEQLMRDYGLPREAGGRTLGSSTGSGVIISPTGRIVTNHHVVGGATETTVTLHDKRRYTAHLVGSDPRTDVAVLQLEAEGPFPWVEFGDSDQLRVGETVVAVGHPFDFEFSVTVGILSARGRRNLARDEIQDYLQTDASVNPGSSGGPLFNLEGQVVGINTAIFNPGQVAANAGISFAIPANMATRILSQLRNTGRVARAGLGLTTRDREASADNPRPGAEITRIVPDGPAELAGLRRGDVVIAASGEPIGSSDDLRGLVLASDVGKALELTIERGDRTLDATVETRDDRDMGPLDMEVPDGATVWGGLVLAEMTDERAARFGAAPPEAGPKGLIVLAVAPASPGAAAGIVPGDVILTVQGQDIAAVDELWTVAARRRSATVGFWRNGGQNVAVLGGLERRER